ncbi:phosphoribosyltransferase family protein [Filibacter tadaridae]|nr:phosphoribosyltransferase family protein [Filibacter tadaridae]
MKTAHSSICCPSQFTHNVGESMTVDVKINHNPFGLPPNSLYEMAARINKKRSFLFVSKVLGKHIPLHPEMPLVAAALLATIYYEGKTSEQSNEKKLLIDALKEGSKETLQTANSVIQKMNYELGEPVIFIGFAETATALGHGVFDCFTDATYIHSTREMLVDKEVTLYFEEEHSHATDQRCYAPEHLLDHERPICLVDDEITTGKTALNIIASIQKRFPRKEYTVLSLLDWRSEEDRLRLREFEETNNVTINTFSLLAGVIQVNGVPALPEEAGKDEQAAFKTPDFNRINLHSLPASISDYTFSSMDSSGVENNSSYSALTGRFGISSNNRKDIEAYCQRAGAYLKTHRKGKKTLCLGTGEFMHIPMKTATYMGEGIWYHSTTRSPIFPIDEKGYPVKSRFSFDSPDDPSIMNYAYNVADEQYDEVFLFFERPIDDSRLAPMLQQFNGLPVIHIVDFT